MINTVQGTLANSAGILGGSMLGLLLKKNVPIQYQQTVMQGLGLSILLIGLQMAFKTQNILVVIISLVLGALIGEFFDIDSQLNRLGEWLTMKLGKKYGNVGEGFITASLVFCVGAMAIVGSIQDGLTGDASTLYAKTMLDTVASIVFASGMGIGVALSSVSVFLYQGSFTILASVLSHFISDDMIREMSAVGGLLIIAIGLLILEIKTIKIANLLPAVPIAAFVMFLWSFFNITSK